MAKLHNPTPFSLFLIFLKQHIIIKRIIIPYQNDNFTHSKITKAILSYYT